MKVLITGGGGQLAQRMLQLAPAQHRALALGRADCDVADADAVARCLDREQPAAVVNAAAYTAVDKAESEPEAAFAVNATGAGNLARAATQRGIRVIQVSTDAVFDGRSGSPYRPSDPVGPLSAYARSKQAGETAVRAVLGERALILRTAWVYAARGRNFLDTMLRLMRERGEVRVVADQVGTPTAAGSLAAALWRALEVPGFTGTHHFTDAGVASWYDLAVAIAEEGVAQGLLAAPPRVLPITTAEYPTPAQRPAYSVLDKSSTVAGLGLELRHWRVALREEMRGCARA